MLEILKDAPYFQLFLNSASVTCAATSSVGRDIIFFQSSKRPPLLNVHNHAWRVHDLTMDRNYPVTLEVSYPVFTSHHVVFCDLGSGTSLVCI